MFAIDKLSPVELDKFIHLQSIIERQEAEGLKVQALREYYDGIHPTMLTDRQKEFLGPLVHDGSFHFSHNLMRSVVDTLTERLSVTGFTVNGAGVDDSEGPDADFARWLWQVWKHNRLDLIEQRIYSHACVDAKTFSMVDYDGEAALPRIVEHRLDDNKSGVRLHRDQADPNKVLFATRYFWDTDPTRPGVSTERKTVYLDGAILKYKRGGDIGAWSPVQDEGDGGWPLAWRNSVGQPLGIAVNEFPNPGGSEIEQLIGLQNALDKSWLDLIAAADISGFPLLIAEFPDGKPQEFAASDDDLEGEDENRIGPGRVFELNGGNMKRIEAANLSSMLEVIKALENAIAGMSRTPQYYLNPVGGSDVPSGESLKQLESGLVAKAKKRQRIFGQALEDTMQLAIRVANAFGPYNWPEDATIEVQWADAETRNELSRAQTAQILKQLGVPDEEIWLYIGYTPEQIAGFKASTRADRAADLAGMAAALRTQQSAANGGATPQNGGTQNGRTSDFVRG